MKRQLLSLITVFFTLMQLSLYSQDFFSGKLYFKVKDTVGIPKIDIGISDTTISMDDSVLNEIYKQNHVYSFTRAFPIADSMKAAKKHGLDKVYILSCNCNEEHLLQQITENSSPLYSYAERIPVGHPVFTPNDYYIQDPYPISGPDSALNFINAQTAWDYSKGDSSIFIGILDWNLLDSTYWNHEDIIHKIVYWDTIHGNSWNFHGLFVSGCAAGNTNNGVGKSSIGFNCRLMFSSKSDLDSAILNLSYHGAKVINISLNVLHDITMQEVINTVTENGTLVVAAAGNEPNALIPHYGSYAYPASYNNVLSVTSIDYNYKFITWASDTLGYHFNYNDSVDICAPGYHVMGLWDSCSTCYKRSSGTSFASPIVAGTAGLIFSVNPCLYPSDVTHILKSTANDTIYTIEENQPFLDSLGTGSLDAGAALKIADSLYKPRDYTIQNGQNITWSDNKYIDRELVIETGGTLTILSTVVLKKNARITVQRGGKLIVDGGKLTSGCVCGMWSGIDVWGDRTNNQYDQSNQGVIVLKRGAVIENAVIAIRTLKPIPSDDPWEYEKDYTGGIIIATDAIFRNNQKAIWFLPYENHHPVTNDIADNYSYFSKCTFETTDTLVNDTLTPSCFADLDGVRGIKFFGCTFRNTLGTSVLRQSRGNGINAINSSFYVREVCLDEYLPCEHERPTVFSGLNYGIKALGTDATKAPLINKSTFDNNYTGIYLASIQSAIVRNDTFTIKPAVPGRIDTLGGLYLNECHYYTVENNKFQSYFSTGFPTNTRSVGIAVNNSNLGNYIDVNNLIYNNRFERLYVGLLAMNKNRDSSGIYGLQIKCNDFIYPNKFDIAVTKDSNMTKMGIKYSQGSGGLLPTDPAGNTFSYTWVTTGDSVSDYYNDCENLEYWYQFYTGGANVRPMRYSIPEVNPLTNNLNPYSYNKASSCPALLGSGGGDEIQELLAYKDQVNNKIDSISGLLSLLVDGGDTPGTTDYVKSSTSNQTLDVRSNLLSKTPYLSDSVMITAALKEDVLPPAIITEILTANPQAAKNDSVMNILNNRSTLLNDDQLATIEAGFFIAGAKESLESKRTGFISEYNNTFKKIIQHYKNDSLNPAAYDSIIRYLKGENQLWSKYSLAFEYISKGDTLNASNTLDVIVNTFNLNPSKLAEHQRYISYINLLKQLKREGKSIIEADSLGIQFLSWLFNNSDGLISAYARNILTTKGCINYREPYIFPIDNLKSTKVHRRIWKETFEKNFLKVYPNPASEYIIIEYTLAKNQENTTLILYNANGKIFKTRSLNTNHDWLILPLKDFPTGAYTGILTTGSTILGKVKFLIVK